MQQFNITITHEIWILDYIYTNPVIPILTLESDVTKIGEKM